jgi:hypothetical protein
MRERSYEFHQLRANCLVLDRQECLDEPATLLGPQQLI